MPGDAWAAIRRVSFVHELGGLPLWVTADVRAHGVARHRAPGDPESEPEIVDLECLLGDRVFDPHDLYVATRHGPRPLTAILEDRAAETWRGGDGA